MIPYPYYLPSFLIKQSESDISDQPLDLSLSTLEKKVIQQFNNQVPIDQISQKLEINIPAICQIIRRKSVSYLSDTNYCTDTFHLNPYQLGQSCYSVNPTSNKKASSTTIEKLKALLDSRQQLKERKKIDQISQKLEINIPAICQIIRKKSVSYLSDTNYCTDIFHLNPYQLGQSCYSVNPTSNKRASPITIEKLKVLLDSRQQLKERKKIDQISPKLEISIPAICQIIRKKSVSYLSDINYCTDIFHLNPYQLEQSCYSVNPTSNKKASSTTIEKLKALLNSRQQLKERKKHEKKHRI